MKQKVTVVAALIWDDERRFMICQRPRHKTRGLLYEFVGGKTEPGETPEKALIRECWEELGVEVVPEQLYMELDHDYPDLFVHLMLYHAKIVSGEPKKLEHEDIRFVSVDQIDAYDFCPADEEILIRLKQDFSSRKEGLHD